LEDKWPIETPQQREKLDKIQLEAMQKKAKNWDGHLPQKTVWIFGKAGVGKSRWARTNLIDFGHCNQMYSKWWCGFKPTEDRLVIVEDWPAFPQRDCLPQHFTAWGHSYPVIGETKAGGLPVKPERFAIVITSNSSIEEALSKEQDRKAIGRRFDQMEVTTGNKMPIEAIKTDAHILAFDEDEEMEPRNAEDLQYEPAEIHDKVRERENQ
jgi:hypothetical protein